MALAPEQAALGIRRHFTADGTHPFAMVEWERRDGAAGGRACRVRGRCGANVR